MASLKYLPAEARLNKAVADAITGYLHRCRDVTAAYLFGSCARGTSRERSDIDVAVLFAGIEDNIIVHDYARLDAEVIWGILKRDLGDLHHFMLTIKKRLEIN